MRRTVHATAIFTRGVAKNIAKRSRRCQNLDTKREHLLAGTRHKAYGYCYSVDRQLIECAGQVPPTDAVLRTKIIVLALSMWALLHFKDPLRISIENPTILRPVSSLRIFYGNSIR